MYEAEGLIGWGCINTVCVGGEESDVTGVLFTEEDSVIDEEIAGDELLMFLSSSDDMRTKLLDIRITYFPTFLTLYLV